MFMATAFLFTTICILGVIINSPKVSIGGVIALTMLFYVYAVWTKYRGK